ncbi:MAG: alpha/beta hydrolase fold domain-containing protein [Pseudomonadota bacterium]
MNEIDWVNGDPVELRRAYAAERAELDATAPPEVAVETLDGGLAGLHFAPPSETGAPILYFHGGGWAVGSPATHRALCAWLALSTRRRVLSVSYPLAPENPYPAQRDAARGTVAGMHRREARFFVAGDSAGGAMALWGAGENSTQVAGVATLYPAYGLPNSRSIDVHGPKSPSLNAAAIAAMYRRMGIAPNRLQEDVPSNGAPVLIVAAEQDPLHDDCLALEKARRGGT